MEVFERTYVIIHFCVYEPPFKTIEVLRGGVYQIHFTSYNLYIVQKHLQLFSAKLVELDYEVKYILKILKNNIRKQNLVQV